MSKRTSWLMGTVVVAGFLILILLRPFAFLFYTDLPFIGFLGRALYIIIIACIICL